MEYCPGGDLHVLRQKQPNRYFPEQAYFLPFAADRINKQIEDAILKADRLGVKIISLAALNKNEALNGGGVLFINKHPDLNIRVVHGNTLTAVVILKGIPQDIEEVFLAGATSKLGRAIAIYLAHRRVRVLSFHKVAAEAIRVCCEIVRVLRPK